MSEIKTQAIINVLHSHGIIIDTSIASEILDAVKTRRTKPSPKYKAGDFIEYYEGMGECGFGEIVRHIRDDEYMVHHWNEATEQFTHKSPNRSISCLSSKETARNYYLVRSGKKK